MTERPPIDRRQFLASSSSAVAGIGAAMALTPSLSAAEAPAPVTTLGDKTLVGRLYESLSPAQRSEVCFDWDHVDKKRGLLRSFVSNNWNITRPEIIDDFYSDDQRELIRDVFESIIHPEWHERYDRQLEDDAGGFGHEQSFAIFGDPAADRFEMVLTGRHMTLRCDGNSSDHVAFGGPIFYGHAPDFNELPKHPGNVFWHQAIAANELYQMLSGRQQSEALVAKTPREQRIQFRGKRPIPGIPVSDFSPDQKTHLQKVLRLLVEMYRTDDQNEVMQCLQTQGGLDACSLAFFRDHDIGNDGVWDNWRLEGPSFVWHYRGAPHVHVWVNIADSAQVATNV